jgi:hypothetical protein
VRNKDNPSNGACRGRRKEKGRTPRARVRCSKKAPPPPSMRHTHAPHAFGPTHAPHAFGPTGLLPNA